MRRNSLNRRWHLSLFLSPLSARAPLAIKPHPGVGIVVAVVVVVVARLLWELVLTQLVHPRSRGGKLTSLWRCLPSGLPSPHWFPVGRLAFLALSTTLSLSLSLSQPLLLMERKFPLSRGDRKLAGGLPFYLVFAGAGARKEGRTGWITSLTPFERTHARPICALLLLAFEERIRFCSSRPSNQTSLEWRTLRTNPTLRTGEAKQELFPIPSYRRVCRRLGRIKTLGLGRYVIGAVQPRRRRRRKALSQIYRLFSPSLTENGRRQALLGPFFRRTGGVFGREVLASN